MAWKSPPATSRPIVDVVVGGRTVDEHDDDGCIGCAARYQRRPYVTIMSRAYLSRRPVRTRISPLPVFTLGGVRAAACRQWRNDLRVPPSHRLVVVETDIEDY